MAYTAGAILHAIDLTGIPLCGASASTDSSAIGTTETVIQTSASAVFKNNRVYIVQLAGVFASSGSGGPTVLIRKGTTTAGITLCDFGIIPTAANFTPPPGPMYLANSSGADISTQICSTLKSQTSGTVTWLGNSTRPRGFSVIDVGLFADFNGKAPLCFIT